MHKPTDRNYLRRYLIIMNCYSPNSAPQSPSFSLSATSRSYRKKPSGLYFSKALFWGTYFWRGLCTEGNLRFKIDWASLILGTKFSVFLCFTLNLRAISKYKPPKGAYIWRGDLTEGFLHYEFGELIFGGACTWRGLFSKFYGTSFTYTFSLGEHDFTWAPK